MIRISAFCFLTSVICCSVFAQTLYVPGGTTTGIGDNTANGNVGIGTNNPGAKLEVVSGDIHINGTSNILRFPSNVSTQRIRLYGSGDGVNDYGFGMDGTDLVAFFGAGGGMTFKAADYDGTSLMRIQGNGNVGIGTTTPQTKLDVNGDIYVGYNTATTSTVQKAFATGHAAGNVPSSFTTGLVDGGGLVGMTVNNVRDGSFNSQSIAFTTHHGGVSAGTRMTIDKDGNVGIGTATPVELLHVSSNNGLNNPKISLGQNGVNAVFGLGGNYLGTGDSSDGNFVIRNDAGSNILLGFNGSEKMRITSGGNVGIGTTSPAHKLAVNGTIRAKEVIVDTGWSDYVFAEDYRLAPLSEVEAHIREKKHLPGIPSATEVEQGGVSVGDMQAKLLAKLEEVTLHLIRMEKENAMLRERVHALETASLNP